MSAPLDTPDRNGDERPAGPPPANPDLGKLWERTIRRLADQGELSAQFQAWIALIRPLAVVEDTVLLAAPHDFVKEVLETRLRPALAAARPGSRSRSSSRQSHQASPPPRRDLTRPRRSRHSTAAASTTSTRAPGRSVTGPTHAIFATNVTALPCARATPAGHSSAPAAR